MLDKVAQADLTADSNSAAPCANSDCDGVPHSVIAAFEPAVTVLGPQRSNGRWDPQEKARITAESLARIIHDGGWSGGPHSSASACM